MSDKLDMKSMDITQDNIAKIKALFPSAVTEVMGDDGKVKLAIDFDCLKQELSEDLISEKAERYQMTWPDKKKAILLANQAISATLRPDKEKSVNFDTTENLYIEGDNLDLSPFVILVSLTFWGWMWGFIGMILAVPMMVILKILCENISYLNGFAILLGNKSDLKKADTVD